MVTRKVILFYVVAVAALGLSAAPARAGMFDLTGSAADTAPINGGLFHNVNAASTGSGVIQSFVRINGANNSSQQGYNTDYRPLEFDENSSSAFTRSLLLSNVPVVDLGGTDYREFLLDINQRASDPLLSLDKLEIYLGTAGNLTGYPTGLGTKIYDLGVDDLGAPNSILLNYNLNSGSGSGDMFAYIPNTLFVGGEYVYLYSMFGANSAYPNNGGFEEWAVRKNGTPPPDDPDDPPPPVPVPGAALLGVLGLGAAGLRLRRWA